MKLEHLDDIVVYGRQWSLMVAIMALRMDWIRHSSQLHMHDWTHWRNLPYPVSRRCQGVFRHLGVPLACL